MAVIYHDSIRATTVNVSYYIEIELSVVIICVYRLPDAATSTFIGQLSDLFDQLTLLDMQFVVVGDFSASGDTIGRADRCVTDVCARYRLGQHVNAPTHVSGNLLDLILSQEKPASSADW